MYSAVQRLAIRAQEADLLQVGAGDHLRMPSSVYRVVRKSTCSKPSL